MRRFVSYGPSLVVLVTAGAVLLGVPEALRRIAAARTVENVMLARESLAQDDILERINAQVRNVATSVEPSVVHIDVSGGWRGATGSGWVYDDAGHVVTNAHVVGPARRATVQFHDGRVVRAEVVGSDAITDIALLRVEPGSFLVPAQRATAERVHQGDRVFAFGSPFGFKFSMSEGIVSGLGRAARGAGSIGISSFIQTDAAVNPGNSGGPLVDVRGRVVGMNVAIATAENTEGASEGQSAGISFAIPLATIESRVNQLIGGGPIRAGYLGISFQSGVGTPIGEGDDFRGLGVGVRAVAPDGPAEKSGLEAGDIIMAIDGQRTDSPETLRAIVSQHSPGQKVVVQFWRGGEIRSAELTLAELPDEARAGIFQQMLGDGFGLILDERSDEPVVRFAAPSSPAFHAGFRTGQKVKKVGEVEVDSYDKAMIELNAQGLFIGRRVEVTVEGLDKDGVEGVHTLRLDPRERR
jgi:S1-C subfamily serine protease